MTPPLVRKLVEADLVDEVLGGGEPQPLALGAVEKRDVGHEDQ